MRLVLLGSRDTIIREKTMIEGIFGEIWKDEEMEYSMNETKYLYIGIYRYIFII